MNRKKNFLMSPLNSNKLQKVPLYNKSKQCYNHSSKMFSFLFFFFQSMYCLFKKVFVLSFFYLFFFSYAVFNNVQVSSSSFFSFRLFSIVLYVFVFVFIFFFFFSFFFIINCSFNVPFFSTLHLPLCLYLNTITIGSLPSLFNFSL